MNFSFHKMLFEAYVASKASKVFEAFVAYEASKASKASDVVKPLLNSIG